MLDAVLTIINVILTVVSTVGAWNSIKYFRKSKNLTIFAQTNKALVEVQKMLIKLPEALSASNSSRRGKKGLSLLSTANTRQLSKASVTSYLPYKNGVYFPSTADKEKISVGKYFWRMLG